ncbi:MAG: hypothetical protein ACE5JG_04845 [Planctomycetota bacterium]
MKVLLRLLPVALVLVARPAGGDVQFSMEEITNYLDVFKSSYKSRKAPEEDAISVIENLMKAYRYLESKGEEETRDEKRLRKRILDSLARGLKVRNRPQVTTECARALGDLGDKSSAKALFSWLDRSVLKEKSPNPQFLEVGFYALAYVGPKDKKSLDTMLGWAMSGKHPDIGVANQALAAIPQWRLLPGPFRKEMFKKIMLDLGGVHSKSRQKGGQSRTYKERYERIKDNGLRALWHLAGEKKTFRDPAAATAWWNANKKAKWEDYRGPKFRPKDEAKKSQPAGR